MKKVLLFVVVFFGLIFLISKCNQCSDKQVASEFHKQNSSNENTDNYISSVDTSVIVSAHDPHKKVLAEIASAFSTIDLIANNKNNLTIEQMNSYLQLLKETSDTYNNSTKYNYPEVKEKSKKLKKELISLQVKIFPKYRKLYTAEVKRKLWEQNIDVSIQGKSITFTGGTFANNKNKQDFYDVIYTTLEKYRFSRINLKWYRYDDEYTYWTLKTPKDSEIK